MGQRLTYTEKRVPSYCDRVLWHSATEHASRLRQASYISCDALLSSDHAAVKATFDLDVPSPLVLPPLLADEAREQLRTAAAAGTSSSAGIAGTTAAAAAAAVAGDTAAAPQLRLCCDHADCRKHQLVLVRRAHNKKSSTICSCTKY